MRKPLMPLLLTICAMCARYPAHVMATVVPPNLPAGSQYQLIFGTADGYEPTSTNISDYNAFVTAEANQNPLLPSGVTWRAVVSTPTVNANVNAPYIGLPVYNTAGEQVESAATNFYLSDLLASIVYDQFGNYITSEHENTWTGTVFGGIGGGPGGGLGGSTTAIYGYQLTPQTPNWYDSASYTTVNNPLPLFALSGPITVPVPEPTSAVIFAIGILGLLGWRRRSKIWK